MRRSGMRRMCLTAPSAPARTQVWSATWLVLLILGVIWEIVV